MISGLFSEDEVPSIIYSKGTWYTLSAWEDDRPVPAREALVYVLIGKLNWRDLYKFLNGEQCFLHHNFPKRFHGTLKDWSNKSALAVRMLEVIVDPELEAVPCWFYV